MAGRRLANSVYKKLNDLDDKLNREYHKDKADLAKMKKWEDLQAEIIADAVKKGLKIVEIPTYDGIVLFWEAKRTSKLVTFEHLWGGPDRYIGPWGTVVIVPVSQADRMLK